MIARDIMTRNIYTISPEASVQEVAQLLRIDQVDHQLG
jgi:CBS domain-containing protein